MTAGTVRSFLPALRRVDQALAMPIPKRVRLLRELEFDLEELRLQLETSGIPANEARRLALEALLPEGDSIRALGAVHAPLYRRLTHGLGERRLRLVERSALVVAAAGVLGAETGVLLQAGLLGNPSPFLWPVVGLGAVLFAAVAAKCFQLWVKGDHRDAQRGLGSILGLSLFILAAGMVGAMLDLLRVAGWLEQSPEPTVISLADVLLQNAALASVSMLLAMAGGLAWFVLTQWLAAISAAHRELLGLGTTHQLTGRKDS